MFSEAFIAKIKTAINLKDLVEEYTELHPAGYNMWQGRCPHPDHNDSDPSFTVYFNKDQTWSWCCYGCSADKKDVRNHQYGSDCFAFLMWMSDYKGSKHVLRWPEAVRQLANKAGIHVEEDKNAEVYRDLMMKASSYQKNLFSFVTEYLHNRGLGNDDIEEWKIGFGTFIEHNSKNPVPRIVFPLISRYGQILGSSRRKLPWDNRKEIPKYINSPSSSCFHKREYLYGIHRYDTSFPEIRITEGQMDVILGCRYGVKNLMAPLGTAFTEEHAKFIQREKKIPCFCLDGDAAGRKATRKKVAMLADMGVYAKILILPDGKDMADMANIYKENLEEYVHRASIPFWQYCLQDKANEFDAKINELRMTMLPDIMQACKSVKSDEENLLLSSYLKERFGISV